MSEQLATAKAKRKDSLSDNSKHHLCLVRQRGRTSRNNSRAAREPWVFLQCRFPVLFLTPSVASFQLILDQQRQQPHPERQLWASLCEETCSRWAKTFTRKGTRCSEGRLWDIKRWFRPGRSKTARYCEKEPEGCASVSPATFICTGGS